MSNIAYNFSSPSSPVHEIVPMNNCCHPLRLNELLLCLLTRKNSFWLVLSRSKSWWHKLKEQGQGEHKDLLNTDESDPVGCPRVLDVWRVQASGPVIKILKLPLITLQHWGYAAMAEALNIYSPNPISCNFFLIYHFSEHTYTDIHIYIYTFMCMLLHTHIDLCVLMDMYIDSNMNFFLNLCVNVWRFLTVPSGWLIPICIPCNYKTYKI